MSPKPRRATKGVGPTRTVSTTVFVAGSIRETLFPP
jgi:hypothetical protein